MRLASKIKKGVGIDLEPSMITLANKNKKNRDIKNITFKIMDSDKLNFPANSFDVVTVKHSPINFKKIYHILKPGGILITQQVHETDKYNLKQAFKRGQNFNVKAGKLLKQYKQQAKQAGFNNIKTDISNMPYYFVSKNKLQEYLISSPVVPDYGRKNDKIIFENFSNKNKTNKGIRSNTSRFFMEMKK